MNYNILLEGKTRSQIEEIAENWYCRLNKLKEKYKEGDDIFDIKNKKALNIILILVKRLLNLSKVMFILNQPLPKYKTS